MRRGKSIRAAFLALGLMYASTVDAQNPKSQAAELARLRAEIEKLEGQMQNERTATKSELKTLIAQKGEVKLMIQKERIRLQALHKERERQLIRLRALSAKTSGLAPALLESVTVLEELVKSSLPFARKARLKSLARIRQGLKARTLNPQNAASQLWQFVEDEMKLCQESGLHQQVITLGNKRVLVDVARLGMVALFFRTDDGRYGTAVKQPGGGYQYRVLSPGSAQEGVKQLFDALKKQIRSGIFNVPLPPLQGGVR